MKKFCKDCKYRKFFDGGGYAMSHHYCTKVIGHRDTPQRREIVRAHIDVANKNNDCKYYEEKICVVDRLLNIFK